LVLTSIEHQRGLAVRDLEIVVADDGSQDETEAIVDRFRRTSRFNVIFTTHQHNGFQLARTRNDGVRASSAPYLVFLDGDCVAPGNHIAQHLRRRRPRTVMAGYCYYLDPVTSARFDDAAIEAHAFERWITTGERRRLTRMDWKARFYALIRHPRRPKLYGGDFGMWRRDFESVNGFNEEFTGWGCEDDEFRIRLQRAGVCIRSILRWTRTFHLWHPPAASFPARWQDGSNVEKLRLESLRTSPRCAHGLLAS
jgi:glycosyltransferase involved in cell wall biosynthesis